MYFKESKHNFFKVLPDISTSAFEKNYTDPELVQRSSGPPIVNFKCLPTRSIVFCT